MDLRVKLDSKGEYKKKSVMHRLSQYVTQPDIGLEHKFSLSSSSQQPNSQVDKEEKVEGDNINVLSSRMKPEYKMIVSSSGPAVQGRITKLSNPDVKLMDSSSNNITESTKTSSLMNNAGDNISKNISRIRTSLTSILDGNNNTEITSSPTNDNPKKSCSQTHSDLSSTTLSSPLKKETIKDKVVKCICDRPKAHVLCTICGFSAYGNVRQPCNAHLRVTYLLTMASCPRCNSGRLMEVASLEPSHS